MVVKRESRSGRFIVKKAISSGETKSFAATGTDSGLAERLHITKRDLAETAGLPPASLHRKSRATSQATVSRLNEISEIITRVSAWTGGEKQAFAWYRAQPIPAFGDRTAESLVKEGKAAALRDYLDHLALGGFA